MKQPGRRGAQAGGCPEGSAAGTPGEGAGAGMGPPWALLRGLLLLLVAAAPGRCRGTRLSFPLRVSRLPAPHAFLLPTPVWLKPPPGPGDQPLEAEGLALASDPAATLNRAAMVDNLQGDAGRGYYLELGIGTPPQKFPPTVACVNYPSQGTNHTLEDQNCVLCECGISLTLIDGFMVNNGWHLCQLNILVDTGSSNFAVAGAPNADVTTYFRTDKSSTYKSMNTEVTVRYTQGSWTGSLGTDVIVISGINGTYTINIATILESENFFLTGVKWQGILGLAYSALAKPSSSVETFFHSLVRQAEIPNVFSLQMCGAVLPLSLTGFNGGSLILGGTEPSLYEGEIWYTPIVQEWYYQVEVLKLEVGGQSLDLDCREYNTDKAIVDSGTTLLRLPEKVFNAVVRAITRTFMIQEPGFWSGAQLACWEKTEKPWTLFPKISIYLRDENASRSFRITILPQLYIQPVTQLGHNLECYRFGISSSTNALVIGATVMEGFYVIFDRVQKRVGFALSACAGSDSVPFSEIEGPFTTEDITSNCVATISFHEPLLWIVSYALMSFCGLVLLVLIILLLLPHWCCHHHADSDIVNDESSLVRHRWK